MNIKTWTAISSVVCLVTLWDFTLAMAQAPAPQLWKDRALQAGDNLRGITEKLESVRDNWNSPQANAMKCEAMLESAFALHLTHESIVHKVIGDGKHIFKILLNGGDKGWFDLAYVYDPKTWGLSSVEFFSLPRGWELSLPTGEARKMGAVILLVKDEGDVAPRCMFGFSLEKPFFAHIVR